MSYANHIPEISHHKASGQAVVRLNGKDCYLGPYGTAASRAEGNRIIGEWLAAGRQLPVATTGPLTISEVMLSYKRHVEKYYRRPDGKPTSEVCTIRCALKPLRKLYGTLPAADFGPLKLQVVREEMIKMEWTRNGINKQIGRIKGFFKWAVSQELVPAAVYHALVTVRGLSAGRSSAAENEPVRPAPQAHIDTVLVKVPAPIAAMINLQLLTGARPGEICAMRISDLDMSGSVWKYKPTQHKTQHHGHSRTILIGSRAQTILKDFLTHDMTSYIFRPADAMAERRAKATAARKTPLTYGNRPGTNRKAKPKRLPGECYSVTAYNRAVRRACDAAEIPHFHVHQLRHNAATLIKEQFGLEVTKTILGHATLSATLLYAEESLKKAEGIVAQIG